MSKFDIGDRVQIKGEPTDWDIGTVTECRSSFGEPYCNVTWDSSPWSTQDEDDLFLVCAVADRPNFAAPKPKHRAPSFLANGYRVDAATLSPAEAVNLASKLLQFATQSKGIK